MNQQFWEELDERLSRKNDGWVFRSMILESFPADVVFSSPSLSKIALMSDDDWLFKINNITSFDPSLSWSKILRFMSSLNKQYRISAILSKWSGINDPRVVAIDDHQLKSSWP